MARVVALVVAAGRGNRFGGELPKQWLELDGRPLLRHALGALAAHPDIAEVRAVIHPDDRARYEAASAGLRLNPPIMGGATRQESVRLGLEALAEDSAPDIVLIHDGARPFVDPGLIHRVLKSLKTNKGAIPALPVHDTLKRGKDGMIVGTEPRDGLFRAQTPQGFHFTEILEAHRAASGRELTDDAAVLEASGGVVALVEGAEDNVKITTRRDLARAAARFERPGEVRVASGYDVHRFDEGDFVTLCNIQVPHTHGLEGHSDADAALHALTDALLGCIAAGDIGRHFPPTDPRWKGADSALFLSYVAELVAAAGGRIQHVDITLICERPKIGPHRAAMVARVAEILQLSESRVSVKATTTEGLGFTGRQEGIAAQATATVVIPSGF
jgi:2-C-methyl-D-erythritol 4-phosphate cytidylyltransferase/2-C-methyl-D-erythritol 2,4-cyclodiphosphate synthase